MKTIINFGDDNQFKRIEGLDINFVPEIGDTLIINFDAIKLEMEVRGAKQRSDGLLIIDCTMIGASNIGGE